LNVDKCLLLLANFSLKLVDFTLQFREFGELLLEERLLAGVARTGRVFTRTMVCA
jgi:hypothetical protein